VTELIELGRDREAAELAGIPPDGVDEVDDGASGCADVHQPTD
jgi:hypothetical protein